MSDRGAESMPNQPSLKKSPTSDRLVQQMLEANVRFRQEQRAKIDALKVASPDKEAFDIQKLADVYNLRDGDGKLRITPDLIQDYESEYYLGNPNIKSLAEFAKNRRKLDTQNSG